MNKRMPQQSQTYEKKRATESNNIPHSNLRFDSPSGYRWLSSGVASGSAVSLVAEATGVSDGGGSVGTEVSVGVTVSVGDTSVPVSAGVAVSAGVTVSPGTADPVGATVDVTAGDSTTVGCGEATAVTDGTMVAVGAGVKLGGGVSTGEDWNNPEFAAESVRHSNATSTSDANTRGLTLSIPRISCCIRRPNPSLFISRPIESFRYRLAKRRVLYQICQAFANPNARAVSSIKKPGARHRPSRGAWHTTHTDARASPARPRATAKIRLCLQNGSDRQYDLIGQ